MKYKFEYTEQAWRYLSSLDKEVAIRITKKMRYFQDSGQPLKSAKELKGNYKGLYRFRVGDYRAIFSKDASGRITVISILRIKHRKDVY